MERALNTVFIDNLTSFSHVSSHMKTVGIESIGNIILPTIEDDVLPGHIHTFDLLHGELIRKANIVPAIWERRRRTTNILFFRIVFTFDKVVGVSECAVVNEIDYESSKDEKRPKKLI